jgi:hypothetical protein
MLNNSVIPRHRKSKKPSKIYVSRVMPHGAILQIFGKLAASVPILLSPGGVQWVKLNEVSSLGMNIWIIPAPTLIRFYGFAHTLYFLCLNMGPPVKLKQHS